MGWGRLTVVHRDSWPEDVATWAAWTELKVSHARGSVEDPDVEVQEQNVDDGVDNTNHSTESRVGSRGPTLSKINTP